MCRTFSETNLNRIFSDTAVVHSSTSCTTHSEPFEYRTFPSWKAPTCTSLPRKKSRLLYSSSMFHHPRVIGSCTHINVAGCTRTRFCFVFLLFCVLYVDTPPCSCCFACPARFPLPACFLKIRCRLTDVRIAGALVAVLWAAVSAKKATFIHIGQIVYRSDISYLV